MYNDSTYAQEYSHRDANNYNSQMVSHTLSNMTKLKLCSLGKVDLNLSGCLFDCI